MVIDEKHLAGDFVLWDLTGELFCEGNCFVAFSTSQAKRVTFHYHLICSCENHQLYTQWGTLLWMSTGTQTHPRSQVELMYKISSLKMLEKLLVPCYDPEDTRFHWLSSVFTRVKSKSFFRSWLSSKSFMWSIKWCIIFHLTTRFPQRKHRSPLAGLSLFP